MFEKSCPAPEPVTRFALALLLIGPACRGSDRAGPPPPAEALFRSLVATATATGSLRAEGRVTYWGDEGRVRLRTVVLAERPASFRVETLTPFEEPIDVVTSDGISLFWLSREALRVGPATANRLGEVLPLPLEPPAVVDVLMGGVPTAGGWVSRDVEPGPNATWRLGLRAADGRLADIWVDRDGPRVRRIVLPGRAEQPQIEVELEDHEGVVARQIDLRVPDRELSVQIRLQSPEYDAELDPDLFIIESPPGRPTVAW